MRDVEKVTRKEWANPDTTVGDVQEIAIETIVNDLKHSEVIQNFENKDDLNQPN